MLACTSTWLDQEREEFEAEKNAVAMNVQGPRPPLWVYTDLLLSPRVPFHDGNDLLGFTDPPVEHVPSPPPPPPHSLPIDQTPDPSLFSLPLSWPPEQTTTSTVSVMSSLPEPGRLKLRIKRTIAAAVGQASMTAADSSAEPPPKKKLSLKLRMSAKEGWVVGRTGLVGE